jgi:DNA-binding protein HU-beta
VNKTELIETLSERLGDRKSATTALDAVLAEIQNAVTKGDKVSITGFGVFEKRVRAARTARNPRTGEAVKVKKTSVPAFRPGAGFKELVAAGKVPKVAKAAAPAKKSAATAAPARKTVGSTAKAAPAPARKTVATPVRAATTTARKTVAPAKATKAVKTTAAKGTAAPAKKLARAASSTTPRNTATARTAAKKAPARATRAAK